MTFFSYFVHGDCLYFLWYFTSLFLNLFTLFLLLIFYFITLLLFLLLSLMPLLLYFLLFFLLNLFLNSQLDLIIKPQMSLIYTNINNTIFVYKLELNTRHVLYSVRMITNLTRFYCCCYWYLYVLVSISRYCYNWVAEVIVDV